MNSGLRTVLAVTGALVGVIAIGVAVEAGAGSTVGTPFVVGPVPQNALARTIDSSIAQFENVSHLAPGSPAAPTVSYVVTSASKGFAFLNGALGYEAETQSGCACATMPSSTQPQPGVTTEPFVQLLTDPAPVAVVEVSGVTFDQYIVNPGGPVCIPTQTCPTVKETPQVSRTNVVFFSVMLKSGEVDDFPTYASVANFPLSALGKVTSWIGPADFQKPLPGPYTVRLFR